MDPADSDAPLVRVEISPGQGAQIGNFNNQDNTYFTYVDRPFIQLAPHVDEAAPGIRTHAEEVAGLSGLRRNLTGKYLPFVPPDAQDEAHPDQLFLKLSSDSGSAGVLLVGAAGTGKTRTCFEVGDRAVAAGWSVLHVKPGEPLVTTDQLGEAIAAYGQVLVIIDYLNECQGIDLDRLAPARPSRRPAQRNATRVAGVCETSLASSDERRSAVSVQASATAARRIPEHPNPGSSCRCSCSSRARHTWGRPMAELCGLRPAMPCGWHSKSKRRRT